MKKQSKQQKQKSKNLFSFLPHSKLAGVISLVFLILVVFINTLSVQQKTTVQQHAATAPAHFVGAFSILSNYSDASGAGVNAGLDYGYDPNPAGDSRSNDYKAANIQIIDQMPDKYLRQFDSDGNMQNLIGSLTAHVQKEQNNDQIIAYWMLDDWSKDGTAKDALVQMTNIIHQYTPGKPTICGFSGNSGNYSGKTKNFSPQGCDMVAPYIYPNSDGDWTLGQILPDIESGLKAQGWDINTTPLVGVPQSYGGANNYAVPTAQQIETETKAFCEKGASAIIFYDFDTGQNPMTNADLLQGVKNGVADCQSIWGNAAPTQTAQPSSAAPTLQPTTALIPTQTSLPTFIPTPTFVCMGSCPSGPPPDISSIPVTTGMPISVSGMPLPTGFDIGTGGGGGMFDLGSIMDMIKKMIGDMFGGMGGGGSTGGMPGGSGSMPSVPGGVPGGTGGGFGGF
jgi:hypothetical protein